MKRDFRVGSVSTSASYFLSKCFWLPVPETTRRDLPLVKAKSGVAVVAILLPLAGDDSA
jgi:hypothetical protein